MKQKLEKIRRIVSSKNPEEYEQKFNEMAKKLAGEGPEIQDVFENGQFTTIFTYTKTEKIPETAKDRFLLEGQTFTCEQCPYLEKGNDKRRKRWGCPYSFTGMACTDQEACNVFYSDLAQGKIQPKGDGDEEETD